MKRQVIQEGTRRFTKRTKIIHELTEEEEFDHEALSYLAELGSQSPSEYLDHLHRTVVPILRSAGLPHRSPVWRHREHGWSMHKPEKKDFVAVCSLEVFVSDKQRNGKQDFPYDSIEGLAASVATLVPRILALEGEHLIVPSIELGMKMQALTVYLIESKTGKTAGRRKKYEWAMKLAEKIIRDNPQSSFEKAWRTIPTSALEDDDCNVHRFTEDGNERVIGQNDVTGEEESLTKETFRTKYFVIAKKAVP